MRVIVWGTYDVGKARTRLLLDGLRDAGVEVVEIHHDLWRGVRDKSGLSALGRAAYLARGLLAYPLLLWRYLRAGRHDAVFVGYLGLFDVFAVAPLARLRGVPVVTDVFLSMYDTVVLDRRMLAEGGLAAGLLRRLERASVRAADRAFMDTPAYARHLERILRLPADSVGAVAVGAELDDFPRLPPRARAPGDPLRVLFYGQLIPLQGVTTILEAAALAEARGLAIDWTLIGEGQDTPAVDAFLARRPLARLTRVAWVEYAALKDAIANADVCLGVFGASEKAGVVVANKVFQALAAGRPVVTRDGPAMRDFFPAPPPALRLVAPADAEALLDGVCALEAEGCPQPDAAIRERIGAPAVGAAFRGELDTAIAARRAARAAPDRGAPA